MERAKAGGDLVGLVRRYQELCNGHEVETAVGMFTEDGEIEYAGAVYSGREALRAAHEYDVGAGNVVEFSELEVEGNVVWCMFVATDELCRIAGTSGPGSPAEVWFEGARIRKFVIRAPSEEESGRVREALRPFRVWAREHYPEEVAKGFTFDYESGASLRRVAEAWRDRAEGSEGPGEGE